MNETVSRVMPVYSSLVSWYKYPRVYYDTVHLNRSKEISIYCTVSYYSIDKKQKEKGNIDILSGMFFFNLHLHIDL